MLNTVLIIIQDFVLTNFPVFIVYFCMQHFAICPVWPYLSSKMLSNPILHLHAYFSNSHNILFCHSILFIVAIFINFPALRWVCPPSPPCRVNQKSILNYFQIQLSSVPQVFIFSHCLVSPLYFLLQMHVLLYMQVLVMFFLFVFSAGVLLHCGICVVQEHF